MAMKITGAIKERRCSQRHGESGTEKWFLKRRWVQENEISEHLTAESDPVSPSSNVAEKSSIKSAVAVKSELFANQPIIETNRDNL